MILDYMLFIFLAVVFAIGIVSFLIYAYNNEKK